MNSRNQRTADGINLEGASYVIIDGFNMINQPRAGIRAVIDNHVTIRNNVMDNNATWGILTGFSDDVLIENNVASHSGTQHGIYFSDSGDRPTIRGNILFSNGGCGIQLNASLGDGGDGIISNPLIENNMIYDNGRIGGAGINLDGVVGGTIRNNLLYNNHAGGLVLYMFNGAVPSTDNLVENNTIAMPTDGRWAVNIGTASVRNTLLNNIIVTASTYRGAIEISNDSLPGLKSDYNAVSNLFTIDDAARPNLAQWQATTGQDLHSFVSTPASLFLNSAANDYHLATTSPAIDTGTSITASGTDLEGKPRPSGHGYDIGAYFYCFAAQFAIR